MFAAGIHLAIHLLDIFHENEPVLFQPALMKGGLHKPFRKSLRFTQPWQSCHQISTHRLEDIRRIFPGQAKLMGIEKIRFLYFSIKQTMRLGFPRSIREPAAPRTTQIRAAVASLHCGARGERLFAGKKIELLHIPQCVGIQNCRFEIRQLLLGTHQDVGVARNT